MIVALLNQKGGVDKTTLALHFAGQWARQGKQITLIDADPQDPALDWSEQRARCRFDRLFGVIGLARDMLHREPPELARHADHIIIDRPPRVAALLRSALLAADLVLLPALRSPFDDWASAELLALIAEVRIFRPTLAARLVLNRCPARAVIVRETAQSPADQHRLALAVRIGQRVIVADAARSSQLVFEQDGRGFAARPRDAESWIKPPDPCSSGRGAADLYTTPLTVDITPSLRGRIKITVFQRGITVTDMLRDLFAREVSHTNGDRS